MRRHSVWLAFTPQDTLLVRDGRSFDAGTDTQARAVWPGPSTLGGAVKAAFDGAEPGVLRGPVLAHRSSDGWVPYFPVPADVVTTATGGVTRLAPRALPVETDLDDGPAGGLEWLTADTAGEAGKRATGWMSAPALTSYLAGGRPWEESPEATPWRLEEDPAVSEPRVGLARTPDRTARTGFLYRTAHLRLREGWAFLMECLPPEGWDREPRPVVALGGYGRRARVERVEGVEWPRSPVSPAGGKGFPAGRVALYLATPAVWPSGWLPGLPPGARLVAAATGEPEPVATASPSADRRAWRESRRLLWAVPAGSVYLLEFADAGAASRFALGGDDGENGGVHGTAYGREPEDRLRTTGFGVVLTGVWR
ncbi:type III-B CRISPR module-associated protein Cmr3 [Streptomyces calidiresistens]|uniref:CRISPR-associated protein Cmr3 n=1 Tax=Streptomyces calidiresistens TaxID=1485586 RepID=A0A7W3SZV3_9ACTN|nr:type III-B CRISPR module-associated Cmr3 family protein [Streptomyces calidiresistens]MBB0228327.1 hypothetical protein [Streptomyces calidiresistens]